MVQGKVWNAFKMPDIAGDKAEGVLHGGCGDKQVRMRNKESVAAELPMQYSKPFGNGAADTIHGVPLGETAEISVCTGVAPVRSRSLHTLQHR